MIHDFDFIADDYSSVMPTPVFIKAHKAFIESMPGMEEHDYVQFVRIRKRLIERLNDPYCLDEFDDETGKGVMFRIIDSHIPSKQVWDMLETFVVCHDWETLTHGHSGFVKTKYSTRGQPSHGEHFEAFDIKLYMSVREIPVELEEC